MDRKPTFFSIATTSLLLLLLGQPANASPTYRWVDDNGNPVLSDRPPETGVPFTEVGIESGFRPYAKPVSSEENESSERPASSANRSTLTASADVSESARLEAVEPQRALCDQARDNIFKLETFARMRVQDDNGEVRFMTDDERASQLSSAYQVRDANCGTD